ncbi:MAG: radical SAM protein [Clostridia bacterium]
MICNLCPNRCNIDRANTVGRCLIDDKIYVARYGLHFWEEPVISGTKGSGAVFFSGCTMRCLFCQNHKISRAPSCEAITTNRLAEIFKELDETSLNINLVSPTPYVNEIIAALNIYKPKNPIIYNTSGYETAETIKLLNGYIDVYLPDLKYVDDCISFALSKRNDYFKYAFKAIDEMCNQVGTPQIQDGLIKKGVIVRHLIIPHYIQNSLDVLNVFAQNFKGRALLSVMSQYTPQNVSTIPEINRTITALEYKRVVLELEKLNITEGFIQDLTSASDIYIPDFT